MKTGSKRGAALAYVIVITAALLILAAALISMAKFNLDASQNSLEGRQAYLDAKSAIEYGRAYLSLNPEKADTSFTILRGGNALGFKIGASGAANYVAKYDKDEKAINAAAKYKSSDRVRRLGYLFGTADGGVSDGAGKVGEFIACGPNFGDQFVFQNWWAPMPYQQVESPYPVMFARFLHVEKEEHYLKAPQVLLFGGNSSNSLQCDNASHLELTSDVIYVQKNIQGTKAGQGDTYGNSRFILKNLTTGRGVIIFGADCTISGPNYATILKGCYTFENGVDLFQLTDEQSSNDYKYKHLTRLDKNPDYASISQSMIDSPDKVFTGDTVAQEGTNWSCYGKFNGDNKPRYIIYKQGIDNNTWINDKNPILENQATGGLPDYREIINYWYLNDVANWSNVLWGNNDKNSSNYYLNVSNVYLAKEINLRYVNAEKKDFSVPEYKTVVFKADKISLSTEYSDTIAGSGTSRPLITHDGNSAYFILEAQNETNSVDLSVPNDIMVQYKNSTGITQSYTIKAGSYSVIKLNLFSDDAKTFFTTHTPTNPPGGSGGTGDVDLTSGVYTDG